MCWCRNGADEPPACKRLFWDEGDPLSPDLRTQGVRKLVVGVEHFASPTAIVAHAVIDVGPATARTVTLCGIPVEVLTVVPGLAWDEVQTSKRCHHCGNERQDEAMPPTG